MKKTQNIDRRIKELQNELNSLRRKKARLKKKKEKEKVSSEVKIHNRYMVKGAKEFAEKLTTRATMCELRFAEVAKAKGITLEFQYPIYISHKGKIIKFFIVDFCDVENHLIIEIDGGYHFDLWQKDLDEYRESMLESKGYKIFRISNDDVLAGKSTAFLYKVYKSIGIDILNKKAI